MGVVNPPDQTARVERVEMDDGVRLWTATTGVDTGRRPVVLLHGGPGLWDDLGAVAALLADLTVVHRYDQRGCGRSDLTDDYRLRRQVDDLEALRRHWGHEQWVVVGHSFGATLAMAYAWTYPVRVDALGHLSGTGLGDWRTEYRLERRRRLSAEQVQRLGHLGSLVRRTRDQEREYRTLQWFPEHADRERAWAWAAQAADAPFRVNTEAHHRLATEVRGWTDRDLRLACHLVKTPVRVIHGEGDPRPVASVAALVQALPAATLHVVPGAGHEPWREQPALVRSLLADLVEPVPDPAADPEVLRSPRPV